MKNHTPIRTEQTLVELMEYARWEKKDITIDIYADGSISVDVQPNPDSSYYIDKSFPEVEEERGREVDV